jgi:alpha-tubulin suppressor-like RCC1 family protein
VTNTYGAVTSAIATLEVDPRIVIEFWALTMPLYATPFGLSNIMAVAAGREHTLALSQDGTVAAWGINSYGQTNVPTSLSNVVAIAAGDNHSVALKSDGTVVVWGDNSYGQQYIPGGLSNVTAIATGANDTFALKKDGTVVGWGNNGNGQLDIPAGLTNVQAIAAGYYNGFAVQAEGTVMQWGNGPAWQQNGVHTQLSVAAGISNVAAVAAGGFSAWSLQNDGSVSAWGWDWLLGVIPLDDAVALAAYGDSTPEDDYVVALLSHGIIASDIIMQPSSPSIPQSLSNAVAISAGYGHAVALVNDGAPFVARQLLNQTVFSGSTAEFCSGVVGAGPLNYQWQFNGANLDGATNASLVLTNVPLCACGNYGCIVTNSFGAATNLQATLTVLRSTPQFSGSASFSNEGFAWQLNQLSGHGPVIILVSTDLVDWLPLFTNPPVTGSLEFLDCGATNQPSRFYRAVEQ